MTNYLRPSQIAKINNVSKQYIYRLCKQGRLKYYEDNGNFYVDQESVIAFMKERKHVTYVDLPPGTLEEINTIIEKMEKIEDEIRCVKPKLRALQTMLTAESQPQQPESENLYTPIQPTQPYTPIQPTPPRTPVQPEESYTPAPKKHYSPYDL